MIFLKKKVFLDPKQFGCIKSDSNSDDYILLKETLNSYIYINNYICYIVNGGDLTSSQNYRPVMLPYTFRFKQFDYIKGDSTSKYFIFLNETVNAYKKYRNLLYSK